MLHHLGFPKHIILSSRQEYGTYGTVTFCLDLEHIALYHFNYCSIIWLGCGGAEINKLGRLQRRGIRCVFNDCESTYEVLLHKANLLEVTRWRGVVIMVYRILNGLVPPYVSQLIKIKEGAGRLRNHSCSIVLPTALCQNH